jgi:agmatinase
MVENRKNSLPKVYGDTPSFLGCPVLDSKGDIKGGYDFIFAGVPWEGTVTWGSYSGCEFGPRAIRHAAARYGGYLPEYDIDLFDSITMADAGDVIVDPNSAEATMASVYRMAKKVFSAGSLPIFVGGDHSFSPEVVRALSETVQGKIGILHFDSHMDNSKTFGADLYPRCGPLHRISQIENVKTDSIVHLAIRGPRNSPSQVQYAKSLGSRIFTIREIRSKGMASVIEEAISIASDGTDHLYVTICSDCMDAAFNPGGPADFNGLYPDELFSSLLRLGEHGISGLDFVEIYPIQDRNNFSSHLAAWAIIHGLVGSAMRKSRRARMPG